MTKVSEYFDIDMLAGSIDTSISHMKAMRDVIASRGGKNIRLEHHEFYGNSYWKVTYDDGE